MAELGPDEVREFIRKEMGRARWAPSNERAAAIEEAMANGIAAAWKAERNALATALRERNALCILTVDDAECLDRVCESFQAEQLHKSDDVGMRFWREQRFRLRQFAEARRALTFEPFSRIIVDPDAAR